MDNNNKKFWDKVSSIYTPLQEKANKKLYGVIVDRCKKYINPTTDVLELACGTGQFTFDLCKRAKSYVATDFSPNMVKELTKRGQELLSNEERKTVTFSEEDATNLSYEDKSFDIVVIANALHIMPDPRRALNEIRRVLKDGGVLIAPTFIYEGKINHFRLWVMTKAGFKTYHKWTRASLGLFLKENNYVIEESEMLNASPLSEGFIVARK